MLKSYGWWVVGGGGLEQFSVSPRPLGFGFGPGLDKSAFFTVKENFDKIMVDCNKPPFPHEYSLNTLSLFSSLF